MTRSMMRGLMRLQELKPEQQRDVLLTVTGTQMPVCARVGEIRVTWLQVCALAAVQGMRGGTDSETQARSEAERSIPEAVASFDAKRCALCVVYANGWSGEGWQWQRIAPNSANGHGQRRGARTALHCSLAFVWSWSE